MNKYLYTISCRARHVWILARKAMPRTGLSRYGGRAADAGLSQALEALETENLSWVMQAHDRSATQQHKHS